ncbi:7967_t:CDS:1, partial [Acaulospora morrowiae]
DSSTFCLHDDNASHPLGIPKRTALKIQVACLLRISPCPQVMSTRRPNGFRE